MCHIENVLQVDAVLDASFLTSFRRQVGEPDDRNPVLQMRRTDVLKHLPLLWSHETYRWVDEHKTGFFDTIYTCSNSILPPASIQSSFHFISKADACEHLTDVKDMSQL